MVGNSGGDLVERKVDIRGARGARRKS